MGAAILTSAAGTHKEIPNLPNPPIERQTFRENLRELADTVKNRAFAILMLAGLCAYTVQGISYAMSTYLYTYVWGFQGVVFVYATVALFGGVLVAFVAAPRIGKQMSKPRAAAGAVAIGATLNIAPYALRLLHVLPDVGQPALLPILLVFFAAATACNVSAFILGASMMADVVEDSEMRTGRRSEGVSRSCQFGVFYGRTPERMGGDAGSRPHPAGSLSWPEGFARHANRRPRSQSIYFFKRHIVEIRFRWA